MTRWARMMVGGALCLGAAFGRGDETTVEPTMASPENAQDKADTKPGVELTLPPVIYAFPGLETSVYFENTVLMINPNNVAFDVTCGKGMQLRERWTFTPQDADVGDYPLTLDVIDQNNDVIASASSVVRVVAPSRTGDLALLMIGDSLTHASIYPARVQELANADERLDLTFVGTHAPRQDNPELRHEGYGGWRAITFTTKYAEADWENNRRQRSPFVFAGDDGAPAFDFARFCREENDGNAPDLVTILLGCNDTFGATEENQADAISTSLENVDMLVNAIKETGPDTRIGILLLAPPAGTQDAFGYNYRCGQTRWQYRRNQHRYVQRTIQRYGNREADGIYLLPTSVGVDPHGGFPSRTVKANAHSEEDMVRLSNGVHPSAVGYNQIGDTVYAWIKAVAGPEKE